MKRILCYGDSNTFGDDARTVPVDGVHRRYDEETRWPCLLQTMLGRDWHIYEAGMNGRTTVFDDPLAPGRCGIADLDVTFKSCEPVDLVIVMLGTNDLKDMFSASAEVISQGLERLVARLKQLITESLNPEAQILILSPIHICASESGQFYYDFSPRSVEKGKLLSSLYSRMAQQRGCLFADAAEWAAPAGADGVHLDPEGHKHLAQGLYAYLQSTFAQN